MIVKNEEKHLPHCLASVRESVDEMIVVDTGSSDGTVEIARSHGAQVRFFQWINDFAAARNESLRHASGDWVLFMDADERLECGAATDCLREAASVPGIDAYLVPLRSHKLDRTFGFHYAIRFFKRFPEICFEGEVHESVTPFLQRIGANFVPSPFFIDHLGYAIDASEMNDKLQRNIALLHKTLERSPTSAFALYYLGMSLLVSNQPEESLQILQKALQGEGLTANLHVLVLNAMAGHYFAQKDYARTLQLTQESLAIIPNQNTARLLTGLTYYYQHQFKLALPYLFMAYQFFNLPPEKRRTGISKEEPCDEISILKAIAVCYIDLKQYPQATAFLHRYLRHREGDGEVYYLLGACCANCDDFAPAIQYLQKAETLGVDPARLSFPLAYACFKDNRLAECRRSFAAIDQENFSAEAEALLEAVVSHHFERGLNREARDLLQRLAQRVPDHPAVLDALGIALIKTGDLDQAIDIHRKLFNLFPANAEISRRLAALLSKTGDHENARKYLAHSVSVHDCQK